MGVSINKTVAFVKRKSKSRDGQFRIIYYSRIVKPNPESESFLVISTINTKAFITSLQQPKHNQRTCLLQCNQIMSARVCIMRKRTHSINVCVCELVFESLHAIDTFTKRKSVNKQRDKACKQNINRILLDSDSLGFESFGFGILNCPSLSKSSASEKTSPCKVHCMVRNNCK